MNFEERLNIIHNIIRNNQPISWYNLEQKLQEEIAENDDFILLNPLSEIIEVDLLLGNLEETEDNKLKIGSEIKNG